MFATVIPNTAFAQDSSNQVPSEQVEFADIYIGDELITVPVVIESEIAGKTARSGVQYEDTIASATYYIPVTEEGKAYNEEYVSGARARGTATDTYLDPRKYLTATSIIRYTMSSNDEYVLINNVAITKNRIQAIAELQKRKTEIQNHLLLVDIYMGLEHRRLELCVLVLQKITGDMSR